MVRSFIMRYTSEIMISYLFMKHFVKLTRGYSVPKVTLDPLLVFFFFATRYIVRHIDQLRNRIQRIRKDFSAL